MAVGEVRAAAIVDTDDPYLTVVAVVPPGPGNYSLDLAVDANFNQMVDPMEVGPMNFIREGNMIRATIGDGRQRPPTAKRYVRLRRVS